MAVIISNQIDIKETAITRDKEWPLKWLNNHKHMHVIKYSSKMHETKTDRIEERTE